MIKYDSKIIVRVPFEAFVNAMNGSYANIMLMQRLRDANIPMLGCLFIVGVRHGRLTFTVDNATNEYVYEWEPDPDDEL